MPHENGACDHEGQCVLLAIWADVGEHMRFHLDSYTLADIVSRVRSPGNIDDSLTAKNSDIPDVKSSNSQEDNLTQHTQPQLQS